MPKKNLGKILMELFESVSKYTVMIVIAAVIFIIILHIFEPYVSEFIINAAESAMQNVK